MPARYQSAKNKVLVIAGWALELAGKRLSIALIAAVVLFHLACKAQAFNAPHPIKPVEENSLRLQESSRNQPDTGIAPAGQKALLTVKQALDEGLLNSPRVAAVRAQLEIARALYASATEAPNPVFLRDEGYIAEQTRRVGAQNTIVLPWKIAFRLLAAKRQVRETKLEILNTLWLFRNDIKRTYMNLVVAQETYQTLFDLAELARTLADISDRRFNAGEVPHLDVSKARLAYSQAKIDLAKAACYVQRAQKQVNVIIGRPLENAVAAPRLPTVFNLHAEKSDLLPDFEQPAPPLRAYIDRALANRLELRITKQQILAAQAQLYNALGSIIPDPVVSTGGSVTGNPPGGPKLSGYFVAVNIELPFFTHSQGDIARLKATIQQYYKQYHAQENQITGEVAGAYYNLIAERERIKEYQSHVLADSEEVVRLAKRSYTLGQSDITAVMAVQQANVQVRSQYLDSVNSYQQAFTELEQTTGEPLE